MLLTTWKGPDDKAKNAVNFNYGVGQALGVWGGRGTARQIAPVNVGKADTRPFVSHKRNQNDSV